MVDGGSGGDCIYQAGMEMDMDTENEIGYVLTNVLMQRLSREQVCELPFVDRIPSDCDRYGLSWPCPGNFDIITSICM